jgi:hypothetical protein
MLSFARVVPEAILWGGQGGCYMVLGVLISSRGVIYAWISKGEEEVLG